MYKKLTLYILLYLAFSLAFLLSLKVLCDDNTVFFMTIVTGYLAVSMMAGEWIGYKVFTKK